MAAQIIINADDFGRSAAINAAVMQAHRAGVLTSASLMVAGDAAAEAVALARSAPSLAVGLHLVVADGRAVLPSNAIPHLVDAAGRFPADPLQVGLRYWFSRTAQQELAAELAAQFERFAATGLRLSHVDGHMHLHIHPTIFKMLLPLAEQYGAAGVRLPRDDLWLALRFDRRQAAAKIAWALALGLTCRWCERRLAGRRLAVPGRVYGVMQSGQMREPYVAAVLRHLRQSSTEIYFHPSTAASDEILGPNRGDLACLLSPTVRQALAKRGLRLTTYPNLKEVQ